MVESKQQIEGKTIRRLYCMDECPNGLWTRLLTRMMMRIDQFSDSDSWFYPTFTQSVRKRMTLNRGSKNKEAQQGLG